MVRIGVVWNKKPGNLGRGGTGSIFCPAVSSEEEKPDHYRLGGTRIVYAKPQAKVFGIVYLEALACGIPVIAVRLDGSRDAFA